MHRALYLILNIFLPVGITIIVILMAHSPTLDDARKWLALIVLYYLGLRKLIKLLAEDPQRPGLQKGTEDISISPETVVLPVITSQDATEKLTAAKEDSIEVEKKVRKERRVHLFDVLSIICVGYIFVVFPLGGFIHPETHDADGNLVLSVKLVIIDIIPCIIGLFWLIHRYSVRTKEKTAILHEPQNVERTHRLLWLNILLGAFISLCVAELFSRR